MTEQRLTTEKRRVFRREDCTWVEIEFHQLRAGDLYRLFEEDGVWAGQWEACTDAEFKDGIWCCLAYSS